jgi:VanZ family protein
MEILQRFCTLTRSGEMADIYADALGALLGLLAVYILAKMTNVK